MSRQAARQQHVVFLLLPAACGVLLTSCGYTTRPGLASYLKTVYVKSFANKIDLTSLPTDREHFPVYRHGLETNVTTAVINRFQFTGLLRPSRSDTADARVEGEVLEFRRDALRYNASQQVEEWRLSVVANVRFYDLHTNTLAWEEDRLIGDTTYFELGANAESETTALDRAVNDLARRVVERTVENW